MMGLVYIARYLVAKEGQIHQDDSYFYYDKYGGFTADLNCSGLHIPGDSVRQWIIYSYVIFHEVVQHCCRKSLSNVLTIIS